jgi:hypothetical protein
MYEAFAPPPLDLMMSGQRLAMNLRSGRNALRDVSAWRSCASQSAASCAGHQGGHSCSSATSQAHAASDAANAGYRSRPAGGTARPW